MVPTRRPSRAARATSALALALAVTLLGACASETDGGGDDTTESSQATDDASEEPSDDATTDDADEGRPDAATMTVEAGAQGKGLGPGIDAPTEGGTGAAWSAEPGLLFVVTYGSSTCPVLAEPDAEVEGGDVVVTFVDIPADTPCTMDYVPSTSVVAVPDDVDPSGEVSVVLGTFGTVVVPPAADGATGGSAWVEQ